MMKLSTPTGFFRIIATLLVLTSLQSCDVCLELLDFGIEMLDDWSYYHQLPSVKRQANKQSYSSGRRYSGSGHTYRTSYRPTYHPNKGKQEEEIIQEEIVKTKKVECTVCNGTGLVEWAQEFYMIDGWCKICQHKKKPTHRHPRKCKNCDGEGKMSVPVDEAN